MRMTSHSTFAQVIYHADKINGFQNMAMLCGSHMIPRWIKEQKKTQ